MKRPLISSAEIWQKAKFNIYIFLRSCHQYNEPSISLSFGLRAGLGRAKVASGNLAGGYLCTCRYLIWVSCLFEPTTFLDLGLWAGSGRAKFASDGQAGQALYLTHR